MLRSAFATQTAPRPTATAEGSPPSEVVSSTAFSDAGSIRVSVSSASSTTQTAPAPAAMPTGLFPTAKLVVLPVDGSNRAIVLTERPAQIEPNPIATGFGPMRPCTSAAGASRTVLATERNSGSRRSSRARRVSAIHTPPAPAASPATVVPGEVVLSTSRRRAETCVTVSSASFATHTFPCAAVTSVGRIPVGTVATTSFEAGSITASELAGARSGSASPPGVPTTANSTAMRSSAPPATISAPARRPPTSTPRLRPGGPSISGSWVRIACSSP